MDKKLYQQIELELLITLVYFFCRKFYKTSKENPKIEKILILFIKVTKNQYTSITYGVSSAVVIFV